MVGEFNTMAKKKQNNRFLNFLNSMAGGFTQANTIDKTTLGTDGQTSISSAERTELVKRISQSTGPFIPRSNPDNYSRYIRPLTQSIAQMKLDNTALGVLAPEIKAAENIVIPSIMSPTDLKDSEITINSRSTLVDEEVNTRISSLLHDHFNNTLKLSNKIPEWIKEALYGAGSAPILVLPITEIDTIMNDPSAILSKTTITGNSTESLLITNEKLNKLINFEKESVFGIADSAHKTIHSKKNIKDFSELRPAIESLITNFISETGSSTKKSNMTDASYNLEDKFKNGTYSELKTFAEEAIEAISIVDNPDILKVDKAKKNKKKADLSQKIIIHYKTQSLITLNPESKASLGNPVVYELPAESVVPVFTPGTPTDHIGYFICLDEFGNPIHIDSTALDRDLGNARRTSPNNLYKSFGVDKHFHLGETRDPKRERDILMNGIYETIINHHLQDRLKESGFDNAYIGATENVYRCLFARYLSNRRTKLLFVPKDFMTYFCFKYNDDGTGRSQIEDIKFILSLKVTLLICRMMASMNNAINRKRINVNFTEDMGDPIQFIEMLKKDAIDKSIVNFTYDVTDITRTLAQRALTVNAKGVPGAENFDITTEPNEQNNIKPDESLMDDINNMMILSLDVTPSAMNLLSENEFSRSVASNNLFFSRKISAKQKIVCEKVKRYIQIYISMSQDLKDQIKDILKQGASNKDDKSVKPEFNDDGTVDDTNLDEVVSDIIQQIETSLPSPDVAPNKTEFEELDAMISSISTALEAVFDNDLNSDDPIAALRAVVKSDLIRDYMKRIGISRDTHIPDIDASFLAQFTEYKHRIVNMKRAMTDIVEKTTLGSVSDTSSDTDSISGGAPPSF